jgi:lauroyl/myristoyl acyltransferase
VAVLPPGRHPALTDPRPVGRRRRPDAFDAYRLAAFLARSLPAGAVPGASRVVGRAMGRVMPGRRAMVARHLRRVRPELAGPALDRAVREAFRSYARYWADSFRLPELPQDVVEAGMAVEGFHHVEAGRAAGKGVILALPHLGGWEWAGRWVAARVPITVVVEPAKPPELFEWFAGLRRSLGMTIVPLGPSAGTAVLRALRANEVVALLCDRDITGDGVEVAFFGEKTTLPAGPVTLALRAGAVVLPAAVYYEGDLHYAVVRPPLPAARTGRLREDVTRLTQDLAHELEDLIRRSPEQWHLFQPNWPSDRE